MFDRQFMSYQDCKNENLRPLHIKGEPMKLKDQLVAFLEKNKFKDIIRNDTYNEINATKEPFRITLILLAEDNGMNELSVLAFTDRLGGGAKSMVKALNGDLQEEFGLDD